MLEVPLAVLRLIKKNRICTAERMTYRFELAIFFSLRFLVVFFGRRERLLLFIFRMETLVDPLFIFSPYSSSLP